MLGFPAEIGMWVLMARKVFWILLHNLPLIFNKAGWPNGKALDYESRDCRFDPCVGQFFGDFGVYLWLFFALLIFI